MGRGCPEGWEGGGGQPGRALSPGGRAGPCWESGHWNPRGGSRWSLCRSWVDLSTGSGMGECPRVASVCCEVGGDAWSGLTPLETVPTNLASAGWSQTQPENGREIYLSCSTLSKETWAILARDNLSSAAELSLWNFRLDQGGLPGLAPGGGVSVASLPPRPPQVEVSPLA